MRFVKGMALALVLAAAATGRASDPTGVYARVDRVVIEPKDGAAQRIQVWGAFCLSKGSAGDDYAQPRQGYMYFRLPAEKVEAARKEWADLRKIAGTGTCVSFGSRYRPHGTVRSGSVKPTEPDAYPIASGLYKVNNDNPVAQLLRSMPVPQSPADGAAVAPGMVSLVVRNVLNHQHKAAKYVFAITSSDGAKEHSDPITAGVGKTKWAPQMKVQAGVTYTWTVQAVEDDWKGPVALAIFRGKSAK